MADPPELWSFVPAHRFASEQWPGEWSRLHGGKPSGGTHSAAATPPVRDGPNRSECPHCGREYEVDPPPDRVICTSCGNEDVTLVEEGCGRRVGHVATPQLEPGRGGSVEVPLCRPLGTTP